VIYLSTTFKMILCFFCLIMGIGHCVFLS